MHNKDTAQSITNCLFYENEMLEKDGAIENKGDTSTITNCTFAKNKAVIDEKAIIMLGNREVIINNCLLLDDIIANEKEIVKSSSSTLTIKNSLINRLPANAPNHNLNGTTITATDIFTDTINGDYSLKEACPDINTVN